MTSFVFPRHPIRYPFHTFRGLIIQPLFFVLLFLSPVLRIFQLDVINQQVVAWGHVYPMNPNTLFWLPIGFFGCVLLIAILSAFLGRLFCGWVCPHNAMTEWTTGVRQLIGIGKKTYWLQRLEKRWPWLKAVNVIISLTWALTITYMISVLFLFYFVPVTWFFEELQAGTLPMVIWWGQGLMMLIGLFMIYSGHLFCQSACPYGLFQSFSTHLTTSWIPMEIRYTQDDSFRACKSCHACEAACPVDIDPRQPENLVVGIGEGCFNCGECIDACAYVRGVQGKKGLLTFQLPFTSVQKTTAE